MPVSSSIDRDAIIAALQDLGLRQGHHVLVHSSLSSMGYVDGGATTAVQALLNVVGSGGTVLVPALTGTEDDGPEEDIVFDLVDSPCWTGAIAEAVRRWPGGRRSAHPTHSVAAVGAAAARMTAGHEDCITPCGTGSPYANLAADSDGVILLLGCDHESDTTLHHVEEIAGVGYHLQPRPARAVLRYADHTETREYWIHDWGTPRNFNAIGPLLEQRGIQVRGRVGATTALLVQAGPLVSLGLDVLRAAPSFFLAREAS